MIYNSMTYIRHALATAEAEGLGIEDLIEAAEEEERVVSFNDKVQAMAFPSKPKIMRSITVHFYEGGGGEIDVQTQPEEAAVYEGGMTDEEFDAFLDTFEPDDPART